MSKHRLTVRVLHADETAYYAMDGQLWRSNERLDTRKRKIDRDTTLWDEEED